MVRWSKNNDSQLVTVIAIIQNTIIDNEESFGGRSLAKISNGMFGLICRQE